jgi:diguanylate cyclase
MNKSSKPTEIEIARETLRRLALEKQPPTPDHYGEMYARIAGTPLTAPFPEKELKKLHQQLPRETPAQIGFARAMGSAIAKHSWDGLHNALNEILTPVESARHEWPPLLRDLLRQMEIRHAGLTTARKKEAVEHVLAAHSSPELLFSRLQALLNSWEKIATDTDATVATADMPAVPGEVAKTLATRDLPGGIAEVRAMVAQLLDDTLMLILGEDPVMTREAREISAAVRTARSAEEWSGVVGRLKQFCYRAHFVAEDHVEIGKALVHLVQLIVDNINELIIDDAWLTGQIGMVRDLVTQPLNLRRIDEVERLLKDVIVKQSSLKKNLQEAKERLTRMLASFVDRLTDFSETTGDYHDKIGRYV